MKWRLIKKIALGILLLCAAAGIFELTWTHFQVKQHTGGHIDHVDPSSFATVYDYLGIKNVKVLSADSSFFSVKNVVLKNGLIESVLEKDSLTSNVEYIDGTDKYLIPGLVDTHVHLSDSKNDLYLYLANGVTSICEMFGVERHLIWKKEAEEGAISPSIYVSSSKLGSQKGLYAFMSKYYNGPLHFRSEKAAKEGIKRLKDQGYDAIKLSSFLKPEIYDAILAEAKELQIPVIGHLSYEVGLKHLYQSGQSQLAHVEEITKSIEEDFGGLEYDNTDEFLDYLKKNADVVANELRENNISVSTTIWLMESLPKQKFDLDDFIKTIELPYVNAGILEGSKMNKGWLPGNNHYENLDIKNNPAKRRDSERFWRTYVEAIHIMTRALAKNGVNIMTGTDANATIVVPGFSLHDEMRSLSRQGMTNAEVIRATTVGPAAFMKTNTGKIDAGYESDLVLLSKNPLDDIENTRAIDRVFFDGYMMGKEQINKALEAIKQANNEGRNVNIDTFKH